MLNEKETKQLCQKIFDRCQSGEEAELILMAGDHSLTRYANNGIHQNVNEQNLKLLLRLYQGQKTGFATGNQLDENSLDELMAKARLGASSSAEDPDLPGPAEPQELQKIDAWDADTAACIPERRAKAVGEVCKMAEDAGLSAFGICTSGSGFQSVSNTKGLWAYYPNTWSDFSVIAQKGDFSVRAESSAWKFSDLDTQALGREAIGKANIKEEAQLIEPDTYTVVLDPYAVMDIVLLLNMHGMSGETVHEGRSWMNDHLGKQAMHPGVTIRDDGLDPTGMPQPFDYEGMPKQAIEIVKNGVINTPVYNREVAKKAGTQTTGHAIPPIGEFAQPMPMNMFMDAGETSTEEMIASTKRGLYITRFWYTRQVHPKDCVITGMTRDGVFLIEDGKITRPLKNLRFTQSYVQALANIETIGSQTRLMRNDFYDFFMSVKVPALKIKDFRFTGSSM